MRKLLFFLTAGFILAFCGCRKTSEPVQSEKVVYKEIDGQKLMLHVFEPQNSRKDRPAFVLFHGGGWFMGEPNGFYPHCRYFASKGIVTVSVQYRLSKNGKIPPFAAVEDAKSAIRFIRNHAKQFGIDPNKIAAGGASAGGHLAASTALFEKFEPPGEDSKISSKPDALVLISAAFDTTQTGIGQKILDKFKNQFAWIYSPDAHDFSPINHVKKISAPCLILHGTADDIVPFDSAKKFNELMQKHENSCQIVPFEGAGHGFSIYDENCENPQYELMLQKIEEFFRSIKLLK